MKLFEKDVAWHNQALKYVRDKRDIATKTLHEWESLREIASNIKAHTITHLDIYLEEFEKNAKKNGIKIHWAEDAKSLRNTVTNIAKSQNAKKIVKSKSMLTEECELNPHLEKNSITVIDTDLGERIVQLRGEKPSHIVLPAIHLKKDEVAKTFKQTNNDPTYLTQIARESLREHFLSADIAITGVNFAIADEGAFVVCTNEGNADLGTSLAKTHIACMGIEKIIPKKEHLGIFTRVLARSATGQAITTYTSHFKKPQKGKQIHLVIVDNQRSSLLGKDDFEEALKCIRCGACMNTCPVFRRSGGHNYNYTIPGAIGSNLGSSKDIKKYGKLSFASTLCGSCTLVCPLKINLHNQLVAYRSEYVKKSKKNPLFFIASIVLSYPRVFHVIMKVARVIPHRFYKNIWGKGRVTPKPAEKSFRELWDE